jgi:hypothetical protein
MWQTASRTETFSFKDSSTARSQKFSEKYTFDCSSKKLGLTREAKVDDSSWATISVSPKVICFEMEFLVVVAITSRVLQ